MVTWPFTIIAGRKRTLLQAAFVVSSCFARRMIKLTKNIPGLNQQLATTQCYSQYRIVYRIIFRKVANGRGPFIHGRLQNLKTSEDTFGLVLTPLMGALASASETGFETHSQFHCLKCA